MGLRTVTKRNVDGALISGNLDQALALHANERLCHLFFFLFYVEISCDYLRSVHNRDISLRSAIEDHATEQVDTGSRNAKIPKLNDQAASAANEQATGHGSMDAAHTNNLGLSDRFKSACVASSADTRVGDLAKLCVAYCANTQLLPQSVNLGPDKIIDSVHRVVLEEFCKTPRSSRHIDGTIIAFYVNQATAMLTTWKLTNATAKALLADAVNSYIHGLSQSVYELLLELENEVEIITRTISQGNVTFQKSSYVASPVIPAGYVHPDRRAQHAANVAAAGGAAPASSFATSSSAAQNPPNINKPSVDPNAMD